MYWLAVKLKALIRKVFEAMFDRRGLSRTIRDLPASVRAAGQIGAYDEQRADNALRQTAPEVSAARRSY